MEGRGTQTSFSLGGKGKAFGGGAALSGQSDAFAPGSAPGDGGFYDRDMIFWVITSSSASD